MVVIKPTVKDAISKDIEVRGASVTTNYNININKTFRFISIFTYIHIRAETTGIRYVQYLHYSKPHKWAQILGFQ